MYDTIKEIVNGCAGLLTEQGFKPGENAGEFVGEKGKFIFRHDEERNLAILEFAAADLEGAEAVELASWLYDGSNPKDCVTIAEDFSDQIAGRLGVKAPSSAAGNVVLPTRNAAGTENTIDSLTQKILAIFPAFKDAYKEHVSEKGSFLYVTFYKETIVPELRELLTDDGNRKTVEKVMKSFAEIYYNCDRTTSDALCGVILAGAFLDHPEKFEQYTEPLKEDYSCFVQAGRAILVEAKKNKKLREILK